MQEAPTLTRPEHTAADHDTVVFLGPTMPLDEARSLLPNACFCPPVQCGDILALLQLEPAPRAIAIIDGVFEVTASVWHKEILYALRRGCVVYGASSMGALRASELHPYGMIGVGAIFEAYRDGELIDDDEVAVLHARGEGAWSVLTDAMVNIRATLKRAEHEGVANTELCQAALAASKALFYQERVLDEVLEQLGEPAVSLRGWAAEHAIDQKQRDAHTLLTQLAQGSAQAPTLPASTPIRTIYLRNLQHIAVTRPPSFYTPWLPRPTRLTSVSRLMGLRYRFLGTLALSLAYLDACAASAGAPQGDMSTVPWLDADDATSWCAANDLADPEQIVARYGQFGAFLQQEEQLLDEEGVALEAHFTSLIRYFRLFPMYTALGEFVESPGVDRVPYGERFYEQLEVLRVIRMLARVWRVLNRHLRQRGIVVSTDPVVLQHFSRAFLSESGVNTGEQMRAWLKLNALDAPGAYAAFVVYSAWFAQCLNPLTANLYGFFEIDASRSWITEALRLSGGYAELRHRLKDPARFREDVTGYWAQFPAEVRTRLMLDCHMPGEHVFEALMADLPADV